jgi:hypothetical protein
MVGSVPMDNSLSKEATDFAYLPGTVRPDLTGLLGRVGKRRPVTVQRRSLSGVIGRSRTRMPVAL